MDTLYFSFQGPNATTWASALETISSHAHIRRFTKPTSAELSAAMAESAPLAQSSTEPPSLQSFPQFSRFPCEIQDLIWVAAADTAAGVINLEFRSNFHVARPGASGLDLVEYLHDPSQSEIGTGSVQERWRPLLPLYGTCVRSRRVVTSHYGLPLEQQHCPPISRVSGAVRVVLDPPPRMGPFVNALPGPACPTCTITNPITGQVSLRPTRGNPCAPVGWVQGPNPSFRRGLDHTADNAFLSQVRHLRTYSVSNATLEVATWSSTILGFYAANAMAHLVLAFPNVETLEICLERRWRNCLSSDPLPGTSASVGTGTGIGKQQVEAGVTDEGDVKLLTALQGLTTSNRILSKTTTMGSHGEGKVPFPKLQRLIVTRTGPKNCAQEAMRRLATGCYDPAKLVSDQV